MNTRHKAPFGKRHFAQITISKFVQLTRRLKPVNFRKPARLCGVLVASAVVAGATPAVSTAEHFWANKKHGKRYLRINEYLFNGTQKVTAIAWQGGCEPLKDASGNPLA